VLHWKQFLKSLQTVLVQSSNAKSATVTSKKDSNGSHSQHAIARLLPKFFYEHGDEHGEAALGQAMIHSYSISSYQYRIWWHPVGHFFSNFACDWNKIAHKERTGFYLPWLSQGPPDLCGYHDPDRVKRQANS
jgi:hypothetical protein